MSILVTDRQSYQITRREFTDQGYLKVPGRVARTGIQQYLASELNLTDREPNELVSVYRPPEEVFSRDSLATYENADVTNDHPKNMVDASTFRDVAVGHTASAGYSDGEYVTVDLVIKDKDAIEAVDQGKASLSAGYEAEYVHEPGQTHDGQPYEFIQRNIRINHVALVDRARAGGEARLYDDDRSTTMPKVVTLDQSSNRTVEVADDATAQLIQSTIDGLSQQVKDAEEATRKANDETEAEKAKREKLEEEMEDAKKASSDSAIQERLKVVQQTRDQATEIAGEKFTCDSVDPVTIRREALKVVRPTMDWDDKGDHYVQAAWDMEVSRTDEERSNDRTKVSHDRLGEDLKRHYTDDTGQMVGTKDYRTFLNGGTH